MMEYNEVEAKISEDIKKNLKEMAYTSAIEHFFCNVGEDEFPKNIWDEINAHDKYDSVSELKGVVVYSEFEDAIIDQLSSAMFDYETEMYRNMLRAIGLVLDKPDAVKAVA